MAVIGLGAMGLPMAQRLAETLPVSVFDVASDRVALAVASGATAAPDGPGAVRAQPLVLLVVRTLGQAEDVLFGSGGVAAALEPGAVVVLAATVGVPGATSLAAQLADVGAELLDMPMSGGPVRARQGDLLLMVSGSDRAVESAAPLLDALGSTVSRVGVRPGDGQAMKVVNQLLCGVHIAAAAEALALAKALGLDPAGALDILGAGAAGSFMLANRGPRIVEALDGGQPEVLSRVDIFVKDMGIVLDAGSAAGVAMPVAGATQQLYLLGQAAGIGAQDDSTVTTLLAAGGRGGEPS